MAATAAGLGVTAGVVLVQDHLGGIAGAVSGRAKPTADVPKGIGGSGASPRMEYAPLLVSLFPFPLSCCHAHLLSPTRWLKK